MKGAIVKILNPRYKETESKKIAKHWRGMKKMIQVQIECAQAAQTNRFFLFKK